MVYDLTVHSSFEEIQTDICACFNAIPESVEADDLLACQVVYDGFTDSATHVQEVCASQLESKLGNGKMFLSMLRIIFL